VEVKSLMFIECIANNNSETFEIQFDKDEPLPFILIGRSAACSITIPSRAISRKLCALTIDVKHQLRVFVFSTTNQVWKILGESAYRIPFAFPVTLSIGDKLVIQNISGGDVVSKGEFSENAVRLNLTGECLETAPPTPLPLPESCVCPICTQIIIGSSTLSCGHTFCRECLFVWRVVKSKSTCPMCRRTSDAAPHPSFLLDAFIDEKVQTNCDELTKKSYKQYSLHSSLQNLN